eukprot:CAMPEP_0194236200 /NCGR_PEP_ID=MMETSP0158-20130606/3518_1 /TAXON_ID=33649 /ORGANISM="Thalassionema nitzschioides, Strain L26-B" /LENGTH=1508 /DNA_ID=CAMNT_0038969907 /DNA_START=57 /DNA_END=4583 /DNA_ORIENTATION=+
MTTTLANATAAAGFEVTNEFVHHNTTIETETAVFDDAASLSLSSSSTNSSTTTTTTTTNNDDTKEATTATEEALEVVIRHPPSMMTTTSPTTTEVEPILLQVKESPEQQQPNEQLMVVTSPTTTTTTTVTTTTTTPTVVVRESLVPSEYDAFLEGHSLDAGDDDDTDFFNHTNNEFEYSITEFQQKQESFDQVEATRWFFAKAEAELAALKDDDDDDDENNELSNVDNKDTTNEQQQQQKEEEDDSILDDSLLNVTEETAEEEQPAAAAFSFHTKAPFDENTVVLENEKSQQQQQQLPFEEEEEEEIFWDEDANREVKFVAHCNSNSNSNSNSHASRSSSSAFSPWSDNNNNNNNNNNDDDDGTTTTTVTDGLFSRDAMTSSCSYSSSGEKDEVQRLRQYHSADDYDVIPLSHSLEHTPEEYPFASPLGLLETAKSYDTATAAIDHPPSTKSAKEKQQRKQLRKQQQQQQQMLQQQQQQQQQRSRKKSSRRPNPTRKQQQQQQKPPPPASKSRSRSRRPSSSVSSTSSSNHNTPSPRGVNALAKVFSRPSLFRRQTTNSNSKESSIGGGLEPTPEESALLSSGNNNNKKKPSSSDSAPFPGPIDYIQTHTHTTISSSSSSSQQHQQQQQNNEDAVSQLTMQKDDFLQVPTSREEEDQLWGWLSPKTNGTSQPPHHFRSSSNSNSNNNNCGGNASWLPEMVQDVAQNYLYHVPFQSFSSSSDDSDPFENLPEGGGEETNNNNKQQQQQQQQEIISTTTTTEPSSTELHTTSEAAASGSDNDVGLNSVSYFAGDTTDLNAYRNNEEEPSPISAQHLEDIVHEVHTDRWMTKPKPSSSQTTNTTPTFSSPANSSSSTTNNNNQQQKKKKRKNSKVTSQIRALQQTMEQLTVELGPYHPKMAASLVALGVLRLAQNEYDLAVDAIVDALRIQKARRDPRSMAKSLHILAQVYIRSEKWDWAMAALQDVRHVERRLYGPDGNCENEHYTLNRMGHVHAQLNEFDDAMEKHLQALQVLKLSGVAGEDPNHPLVCQTLIYIGNVYYQERNSLDTNIVVNNNNTLDLFVPMIDVIARAHDIRGNYKQALGFLEEKLQLVKPVDAALLNGLGTLSCKCGQYMEAMDYYEQALEASMMEDNNNNTTTNKEIHTATAHVLMGSVEHEMGNHSKAWELLEAARLVMEREFGSDSEVVADVRYRQGWVQLALERFDDCRTSWQHVLTVQTREFGPHDLAVLQTRLALYEMEILNDKSSSNNRAAAAGGDEYYYYEKTLQEITTIQQQQEEALGQTSHPILANTMLLLAKVHLSHSFAYPSSHSSAPTKSGIRLLRQSFHMRERFLGRDHPLQATTFYWLAITGIRLFQKHKQGIPMLHSVLRVWKETVGESHRDVAMAYHMLGRCHLSLGEFDRAHTFLDLAWSIVVGAASAHHPPPSSSSNTTTNTNKSISAISSMSMAQVLVSRGMLQLKQCDFHQARESLQTALSIYTTRLGMKQSYYLVKEAKEYLEKVERDEMLCV